MTEDLPLRFAVSLFGDRALSQDNPHLHSSTPFLAEKQVQDLQAASATLSSATHSLLVTLAWTSKMPSFAFGSSQPTSLCSLSRLILPEV